MNKTKERQKRRQKGLNYVTLSGTQKLARKLQKNPCKERKCPHRCYEINEERRQSIFDYYWRLNNEKKRD